MCIQRKRSSVVKILGHFERIQNQRDSHVSLSYITWCKQMFVIKELHNNSKFVSDSERKKENISEHGFTF